MSVRLEQRMHEMGLTQGELARRVGTAQPTIHRMLQGIHSKHLPRVATELGVTVEWLLYGVGDPGPGRPSHIVEWEDPEDLPPSRFCLIPRKAVRLSCGDGHRVEVEPEDAPPLVFSTAWVRKMGLHRDNAVVVEARGDSMAPRIRDGDTLLVDLGKKKPSDGNIYALRYGDDLKVKRLFRRYDGALTLVSDSAEYPDEAVPPDALAAGLVEIIGLVVWIAGQP